MPTDRPHSDQPELGSRIEQALLKAAHLSAEALRAEKLAKRVQAACYLAAEGTVAEREATARTDPKFTQVEDAWLALQHQANIAEAEAEALRIRMEIWRTQESTKREEMKIR